MFFYETYGYEFAEQYLTNTKDEIERMIGEGDAKITLDVIMDNTEAPEIVSGIINSLFILPTIAGIHGGADAIYGLAYATEMLATVAGVMDQNRTKNSIDYKRMYVAAALMPLSERIENGFVIWDEETGQYITNPMFHQIDFTAEYPGIRLDWEYKGLKLLGRWLPFKLIFMKCPIVGDILYGICQAGHKYHEKMINGDDFIESVVFSTLQGASYPIAVHYIRYLPIFAQNGDTQTVGGFLKGIFKSLPFIKDRDPKTFMEILNELKTLLPTIALQTGARVSTTKINETINHIIAEIASSSQVPEEELDELYQMIETGFQPIQ